MENERLPETELKPEIHACLAIRQAARHITQFYTTQFSVLTKLRQLGPMTINALANELVMDRTTLGRNILPLQRDGLIAVVKGSARGRGAILLGSTSAFAS